jgi:hypothetical protein
MAKEGVLPGEIVIEVDHPKNSDLYFFPTGSNVRSVVQPFRSGAGVPATFTPIARIPGQRIHVDVKGLRGRITDALGDPGNARILDQVKTAGRTHRNEMLFGDPHDDAVFSLKNLEEVHQWLYWMARAVEAGHARKVQGDLKPSEELQNGGDILIPSMDLNARRLEYGDTKYLKPTNVPAKAAS